MNNEIKYIKPIARNRWVTEAGEEIILRYSGKRDSIYHKGKIHVSGRMGGVTPYEEVFDLWLGNERLAREITEDELNQKLREHGYQIRR